MRLTFGDYELDTTRYELRHNGQVQAVEPQVFNVLVYLAQNRDRAISRQELLDELWAGKIVSESTLSSCIKAARKAIGDDGRSQSCIATLNRRGYRFVRDVAVHADDTSITPSTSADGDLLVQGAIDSSRESSRVCLFPVEPSSPDRPSLAVLPFTHGQGNEAVAWVAEALGDDISMSLARIPGFLVISRNSMARYEDGEINVQQIRQELGINYLVEGSVREAGNRLRISVQLLETATGSVLWADRTEIPSDQLNEFQDEVVLKIVNCIEPAINRAELTSLRKRRTVDLGAWQLYRQGHAIIGLKGWSEESFHECADLLRQAIERDPELAFAHAYLALVLTMGHLVGLLTDENWQPEAITAAEKAIELDNQDSDVLGYAGCALADMGNHLRGIGMLRRSVELNPSNAQAHAALGAALLQLGEEEGIEHMVEGIRISPRDTRLAAWGAMLARGLLNFGRVDEAVDVAETACRCDDKIFLPRIILAIARSQANDMEGAKAAIEDARRIRPQLGIEVISRFARPEEVSGLKEAALI
ncbi:winged helix-turn-helix domain-containing tetratricopeptide repeat protein [Kaarinaea lacus]